MIEITCDTYLEGYDSLREITFSYDSNNVDDRKLLADIINLLGTQKRCNNCVNYRVEGYFCGYNASSCVIHGNIEAFNHPHRDGDGSKCDDYERMIEVN